MENVHVVIVYDCLDILNADVTHFNFIFVKGVFFFGWGGKWGWGGGGVDGYLSGIRRIGDWPIVVMALLLYVGLNYKTFRWRSLFLFSCLLVRGAWQTNLSM